MSPEQAAGDRDLDGRSDLYSLACVIYETLAGEPPFAGASARAVMAQHLSEAPPPLRARRPDAPAAVEQALARALAKDPADRFATVAQFVAALEATDAPGDRKSTRLNSSHSQISYAVFCLKKKNGSSERACDRS